jgi:hypothetical protein
MPLDTIDNRKTSLPQFHISFRTLSAIGQRAFALDVVGDDRQ